MLGQVSRMRLRHERSVKYHKHRLDEALQTRLRLPPTCLLARQVESKTAQSNQEMCFRETIPVRPKNRPVCEITHAIAQRGKTHRLPSPGYNLLWTYRAMGMSTGGSQGAQRRFGSLRRSSFRQQTSKTLLFTPNLIVIGISSHRQSLTTISSTFRTPYGLIFLRPPPYSQVRAANRVPSAVVLPRDSRGRPDLAHTVETQPLLQCLLIHLASWRLSGPRHR